jgi:CrcB protein
MIWLVIAAGGAIGAMARHGVNHVIHQRALASTFPAGIFIINVGGSFAIGLVAGAVAGGRLQLSHAARTFILVGVLGGFTTFSSFSLDTLALAREGHHSQAALNAIGQVVLSLAAVWAGWWLTAGK